MKYLYILFLIVFIDFIVFVSIFQQYSTPLEGIANFLVYGGISSSMMLLKSNTILFFVAISSIVIWFVRSMLIYSVVRATVDLSPFK